MSEHRGKRRQLFVSREIQGQVLTRIATYWVLYHVALWHGMLLYGFIQSTKAKVVGQFGWHAHGFVYRPET